MPSDKFCKKERLAKTRQFNLVYQKGALYRAKNLKLWVMPNQAFSTRVGFLVTKRNAPNLVGINRIKRLLKEAHRLNKHNLKKGFDLVIAGQGMLNNNLKLEDIESNLLDLFRKAGVLC